MKNIVFFVLLLCQISYSQTLKGIISFNPQQGIGDSKKLLEKEKKPIYYSYSFSNDISMQELISIEGTTIDTSFIENQGVKFETTHTLIQAHQVNHFKDFKKNIYRFESSRKNKNLVIEHTSIKDTIPVYNWQLFDDMQTIAGFNCKKATTTRKVGRLQHITAWYCEDISIPDGPMAFRGLPGLILQIEIDKNTIVKFEKLKFFKDENIDIKEPDNNTKMLTISEYINKMMNGG